MDNLLELLRGRFEESSKRLDEVMGRLRLVQAEYTEAQQDVSAWKTALEREQARQPATVSGASIDLQGKAQAVATAASTLDESQFEVPNKTKLIQDFIMASGSVGTTSADIIAKVKENIPNRNYVYTVIYKLKSRGLIRESRGRYYAVSPNPKEGDQQTFLQ